MTDNRLSTAIRLLPAFEGRLLTDPNPTFDYLGYKAGRSEFETFGLIGLTHLLNPEIVHTEESVGVFVLKNLPLAKVGGGAIIRET